MKKKRKYNKNRLKIFIALSLMITTIFSVMFATNTFAYNDNYNKISDTLDTSTLYLGNFNLNTTIKTELGSNNENYSFIEVQHTASESIQMSFGINLKSGLNYDNSSGNYIALMNVEFGYYSTSTGSWTTYINSSQYLTAYCGPTSTTTNYGTQTRMLYYSQNDYGYNYKSAIIQLYNYNSANNFNNIIYFNFRLPKSVNKSIYCVRIYNIDIVPNNEIYTQQYIDTYYTPLEEQYNQLLEDYETLESNYDTLNDNYTDLESNYNQIERDYNTLQENYNLLQQEYNELNNYSSDGILSFMRGAYVNNYMENGELDEGQYLNLDNLINLNATNQNTFNVLNASIYSLSHNNRTISVFFGYNNHTFVYSKVPSNILDLSINTNLSPYLDNPFIRITLSNYESSSLNSVNRPFIHLVLTPQQLASIDYNITENNLISLFSYDYQYYNNFDEIRFEFACIPYGETNYNDQYYTFTSTNAVTDQSYLIGYNNGVNAERANSWEREKELSNRVDQLQMEIRSLNQVISGLNEQISAVSDNYSLNNLMWTIGGVPFESFKQIWNVNFLGVNIADFIFGIITTFIGIYIVKKFFL